MSGMIGKFLRSKQGKEALNKAKKYAQSEEGKQKIEQLKGKVEDFRGGGAEDKDAAKPAAKPAPAAEAKPAPAPKPAAGEAGAKPDPQAPENPSA